MFQIKDGSFYALDANWTLSEKESSTYFTLSNLISCKNVFPMENSSETGKIYWIDSTFENGIDVQSGESIWVATYIIDKDTPVGIYTIELTVDAITGGTAGFDSDENFLLSASISVKREEIADSDNEKIEEGNLSTNNEKNDDKNSSINNVKSEKKFLFTDVSMTDWYYNAVKYTYDNNIISGYNPTIFAPNDKLTRGMIVTILYRMEGEPNNNGKSKFEDVDANQWYSKAIKWAVDNGIVHGYGGTNKFGPDDNIIRQDLAGILRNYASYKKKNVNITVSLTKFKDYKLVDSYAKTAMEWAVGAGVITGNADQTLNPKGNATRAEAAAMIEKYCKKVGK